MLRTKKFPYALFFGHLALEKLLKALVVRRTGQHAPYTHSLILLARRAELDMPEALLDQLAEVMEFHTEARYPDVVKDFYKKCTSEFARAKFREIKKVYAWCQRKLGK
ncbi:MAG: HEPN domain-containing protein [Deferrisomatales bacterium]|nr:HEPN domain-containing protein [Deferrisomatales bacterium]